MRFAGARATATGALCGLLLVGCGSGTGGTDGAGKSPGPATSASRDGGASASPSDGTSPGTAPPAGTPTAPAASTVPPTAAPPSTPPAPTVSVPGKEERLVAATASGGIDGRHRSVLVNDDGSYTLLDRKKPPRNGQMKPGALKELRAALKESDFAALPRVSVASPPIADGIATAVIYQGREVVTDGMKKIPKLDRVIAALPGLR